METQILKFMSTQFPDRRTQKELLAKFVKNERQEEEDEKKSIGCYK